MSKQKKYNFRLYDVSEIINLPVSKWQVAGIFKENTCVELFGDKGSHKSFLTLHWAMCIGLGREWMKGKPCRQGEVVYIVGEGFEGFGLRVAAWLKHHKVPPEALEGKVKFVREPVLLSKMDMVAEFIDYIKEQFGYMPALVVFDTLSRSIPGADENSTEEMTLVVASLSGFGTSTFLIHHTPRRDDRQPRGNSAIDNATHTCMGTLKIGGKNSLKTMLWSERQKDVEDFPDHTIYLEKVEFPEMGVDELGNPYSSLAVSRVEEGGKKTVEDLTPKELQVYNVICQEFGVIGAGYTEWLAQVREDAPKFAKSTFSKAVESLVAGGLVYKIGETGPIYMVRDP